MFTFYYVHILLCSHTIMFTYYYVHILLSSHTYFYYRPLQNHQLLCPWSVKFKKNITFCILKQIQNFQIFFTLFSRINHYMFFSVDHFKQILHLYSINKKKTLVHCDNSIARKPAHKAYKGNLFIQNSITFKIKLKKIYAFHLLKFSFKIS